MVNFLCWVFILIYYNTVFSLGDTLIGVSSSTCTEFGCNRLYVAEIDRSSGYGRNVTLIPSTILDAQNIDLIHSATAQSDLYYIIYTKVNLNLEVVTNEKTTLISYNTTSTEFNVIGLETKIKVIYSICYSNENVFYGLGWLPTDTIYTLSAFRLDIGDWSVTKIMELPGLYNLIPDCTFNPQTQKLYFYFRNFIDDPSFKIWEVDINSLTYNEWNLNISIWSQPYLLEYDPTQSKILALIADAKLNTILAYFNPTNATDPFIIIKGIPDQPLSPQVVTYSPLTGQFIFITHGDIISLGVTGEDTISLQGLPDYAIKTMSCLSN